MKPIARKAQGYEVSDIQQRLNKLEYKILDADGYFGYKTEEAVKQFQQDRGLLIDGVVGEETWAELVEATYFIGDRTLYLSTPFQSGDDIKTIQLWLRSLGFNPGPIDGTYGPKTEEAVKSFQFNYGIDEDGIVSFDTIKAFYKLANVLEANENVELPLKKPHPLSSIDSIVGKKILLDFGHGGSDTGAVGPGGLKESLVCEDIGLLVGDLLAMLGAKIIYTRSLGKTKDISRRIALANKEKASLLISIHLNHSTNQKAEGSSTYYYAGPKNFSVAGKKLAESILAELISQLKTKDCRSHGKNFNILRLTKMTAVLIEPVFITNPTQEKLLKKSDFKQKIAYAIFDGLKKYLEKAAEA
ncbi:MAG: hypothetical protein C4562_02275 [Actinobacteria bacterium]|nr:MAG: hypothetical protein C4562_02275 [Actinomycetota bacterium]